MTLNLQQEQKRLSALNSQSYDLDDPNSLAKEIERIRLENEHLQLQIQRREFETKANER